MLNMVWPIAVIVFSNIFYNVCTKSTPENLDPFASLTITYVVGAIVSAIMYFALNKGGNLLAEYKNANWTAFVLGIVIVGLEVGSIYMYKVGWNVSSGMMVHSTIVAILLIGVGVLFYKESVSITKILGVLVCLAGLYLINR